MDRGDPMIDYDDYMFSKFPEVHRSEIRITENRAPTDASVRLLREMEDAAKKNIVSAIKVADNTFECIIHQAVQPLDCNIKMIAIFKLNGKKMTVEETFDYNMVMSEIIIKMRDAVAKEIANNIATAFEKSYRINQW